MLPDPNRLCAAFPWPQMAFVGLACLLVGIVIGFVWGRASKSSNSGESMTARLHATYNRWAWLVAVLIGVLALVGIWIGTVASVTNGRQDEQRARENAARDHYNATLLQCFDQFADDLTDGLPPVRNATVARDDGLREAMKELRQGFIKVQSHTFQPTDLQAIIARISSYLEADEALSKARLENPYPAAPSTFCNPSAK